MPLPHFSQVRGTEWWGVFCEICGENGHIRGFGKSRYDKDFFTKNLCEKHYKIELRKQKLEKINENNL